ncbi:lipocalin family protein [Cellulomonas septica]|uniref:Lipocalin family protein n=1 Tax=Cellulomonas septica TaxID=285080 RepID=A0ABX1K0S7_9CELL|nr:lipocalin family protein [Cellulomonas septica]NKY39207.1 lipocalin family protein [Cellulomonas septica]
MRRVVGGVGAAAVVAAVAVVWASSAGAAEGAAAEVQSSLVEDFAYPGADAILAEHGLKVFTGDGHVEPVSSGAVGGSCAPGLIQVETLVEEEPYGSYYCFRTSGSRGFLTLEVPHTFLLRGGDKPVEATAELASGAEETYAVAPNTSVAVDPGEGAAMPQAILVELRFGAW